MEDWEGDFSAQVDELVESVRRDGLFPKAAPIEEQRAWVRRKVKHVRQKLGEMHAEGGALHDDYAPFLEAFAEVNQMVSSDNFKLSREEVVVAFGECIERTTPLLVELAHKEYIRAWSEKEAEREWRRMLIGIIGIAAVAGCLASVISNRGWIVSVVLFFILYWPFRRIHNIFHPVSDRQRPSQVDEHRTDPEPAAAAYPPPPPFLPKELSPKSLAVLQQVAREWEVASKAKASSPGITDDMAADVKLRPPSESQKMRVYEGGPRVSTLPHYRSTATGDDLYKEALASVISDGVASVSLLQRRLGLGLGRSNQLLERMQKEGIVGPIEADNTHKLLVTPSNGDN